MNVHRLFAFTLEGSYVESDNWKRNAIRNDGRRKAKRAKVAERLQKQRLG